MSRRYGVLFLGVLAAAIALTLYARMPRGDEGAATVAAEPPLTALAIELREGAVIPATAAVPKGDRVRLHVRNAGRDAVRIELGGYAHALPALTLAPGAEWEGTFLADLPGEDFPWLVNGEPAGRLTVTGSHLVEGHR